MASAAQEDRARGTQASAAQEDRAKGDAMASAAKEKNQAKEDRMALLTRAVQGQEARDVAKRNNLQTDETLAPSSILVWGLVITGYAAQKNWPQWRGPDGDGIPNESVPTNWGESKNLSGLKLPGPGASSPITWDNQLFLTCYPVTVSKPMVTCKACATWFVWIQKPVRFSGKRISKHRAMRINMAEWEYLNTVTPPPTDRGKQFMSISSNPYCL